MTGQGPGETTAYLVFLATDRGRLREQNEDAVFATRLERGPGNPWNLDLAAAVADGMGGHVAGARASQAATDLARQLFTARPRDPEFRPPEDMAPVLKSAFERINDAIRDLRMGEGFKPAGTTLLLACVRGSKYWLSHIGDSRAYLITANDVVRLTEDHTWVADQVRKGLMSGPEADASPFRNQLTQAIGTTDQLDVEVHTGELGPATALVLCTDGLTEYVTAEEIAFHVRSDPATAVERLIALANARGGEDNISLVIIAHPTLAAPAPARTIPQRTATRSERVVTGGLAAARATTKKIPVADVQRHLQKRRARRGAWVAMIGGVMLVGVFLLIRATAPSLGDTPPGMPLQAQPPPPENGPPPKAPRRTPSPAPGSVQPSPPGSPKQYTRAATQPSVRPQRSPGPTGSPPGVLPGPTRTRTQQPTRVTSPAPLAPVISPATPALTSSPTPVTPPTPVPTPTLLPTPAGPGPSPAPTQRVTGELISVKRNVSIMVDQREIKVLKDVEIIVGEGQPVPLRYTGLEHLEKLFPGVQVTVTLDPPTERAARIEAMYLIVEGDVKQVRVAVGNPTIEILGRGEFKIRSEAHITLDGKEANLADLRRAHSTGPVTAKIWRDPATKLVLRIEAKAKGKSPSEPVESKP